MWIDIEPDCELPKDKTSVPVMLHNRQDIGHWDNKYKQFYTDKNGYTIYPIAWYKVPPYQPKKQEQP